MFRKTVDSIVSDITSKIAQLHALAERKRAEADVLDAQADKLIAMSDDALNEAARADRLATNFEALVR